MNCVTENMLIGVFLGGMGGAGVLVMAGYLVGIIVGYIRGR